MVELKSSTRIFRRKTLKEIRKASAFPPNAEYEFSRVHQVSVPQKSQPKPNLFEIHVQDTAKKLDSKVHKLFPWPEAGSRNLRNKLMTYYVEPCMFSARHAESANLAIRHSRFPSRSLCNSSPPTSDHDRRSHFSHVAVK